MQPRPASEPPVEIVIATRDRRERLLDTLGRLGATGAPPVTVVDDGSADGTAAAVSARFPAARLVRLARSRGAAARNVGVATARARYVAFCDDDSWWAPGALDRAVRALDATPRLGVLAARVEVGPACTPDPICALLAASPLDRRDGLTGPRVLGFLACGAVVRRRAFLDVGGFPARFGVGGEEGLLAIDLARRGWWCSYAEDVVAHHEPEGQAEPRARRVRQARNAIWTAWLRRPPRLAARATRLALAELDGRREAARALAAAARGGPWVLRQRDVVDQALEADLRLLEGRPRPAQQVHRIVRALLG